MDIPIVPCSFFNKKYNFEYEVKEDGFVYINGMPITYWPRDGSFEPFHVKHFSLIDSNSGYLESYMDRIQELRKEQHPVELY